MTLASLAAVLLGIAVGAASMAIVPPKRRLEARVTPYAQRARLLLGRSTDTSLLFATRRATGSAAGALDPLLRAGAQRISALVDRGGDAVLARRLRHAGERSTTPDQYRLRQLGSTARGAAGAAAIGLLVSRNAAGVLILAGLGGIFGAARSRARTDKAIDTRCERMRAEQPVLAQLIAIDVYHYGRGASQSAVVQAVQAGSRANASPNACQRRASEALDALLGGPLGDTARVSCTDDGTIVRAQATASFEGWLDVIPDRSVTVTATANKRADPVTTTFQRGERGSAEAAALPCRTGRVLPAIGAPVRQPQADREGRDVPGRLVVHLGGRGHDVRGEAPTRPASLPDANTPHHSDRMKSDDAPLPAGDRSACGRPRTQRAPERPAATRPPRPGSTATARRASSILVARNDTGPACPVSTATARSSARVVSGWRRRRSPLHSGALDR